MPCVAFAQAEPAPSSYEPPPGVPVSMDPTKLVSAQEAEVRRWVLAVQPRLVIALGNGGGSGLPRVGFGAGASLGRAVVVNGRVRLGLGLTFSYERFQHEVKPGPSFQNGETTQFLSHAAFSLDLRLDWLTFGGRVRPWVMVGPAFSVASYSEPPSDDAPSGLSRTEVLPALRAAIGLGVEVTHSVELGARAEWLAMFDGHSLSRPAAPTPTSINPFEPGDFSLGIDVAFRF